jgi:hypothetical protein
MIISAVCNNDGGVVRSSDCPLRLDLLEKIVASDFGARLWYIMRL